MISPCHHNPLKEFEGTGKLSVDDIDTFVFDFDGVLTNNLVYLDQNGKESVSCSRADGLAFDLLRQIKKPTYILSTEKSLVVTARANKLKVPVIQGVGNKVEALNELASKEGFDLTRVLYVGNDLNDYRVMQLCGYAFCPFDSHPTIKDIAMLTLKAKGGEGIVRELLEDVLGLDFVQILY